MAREREKSKAAVKFEEFAYRLKNALSNALYPEGITCDCCGNELVADMRYRLCSECVSEMPFITGHRCLMCGMPIDDEADYCLRCQNTDLCFKLHRSPLEYDGLAKSLIYKLKFSGKQYITYTLGAMMADEFISSGMQGEIVVFTPMTREEEKRRGFNQAELLAREVADRLKLPLLPALIKLKETPQQKKLNVKERASNLEGAFNCTFKQVKGRIILLVDDIFTTGATANECSKTLLKAGAKSVYVLTAATTKQKLPMEKDLPDV